MAELKVRGVGMQPGDPYLKRLTMQWDTLERELNSIMADMNTHRNRYNTNQKVLEMEHVQTVFQEIPPKISMDDIKASVKRIMDLIMQGCQYNEMAGDVGADGAWDEYNGSGQKADVSGQIDFFVTVADEQTKNVFSGINNVTVGEFGVDTNSCSSGFSQDNPFAF